MTPKIVCGDQSQHPEQFEVVPLPPVRLAWTVGCPAIDVPEVDVAVASKQNQKGPKWPSPEKQHSLTSSGYC